MSDADLRPLLGRLGQLLGGPVKLLGPAQDGESGKAYRLTGERGPLILKVQPGGRARLARETELIERLDVLRSLGYPIPEFLAVGEEGELLFTVQEQVAGEPLSRAGEALNPALIAELVPQLVTAVELQAGLGQASPWWPWGLVRSIEVGGDGYCRHDTMRATPATRALLERLQGLVRHLSVQAPSVPDLVHFDLNPTNILHRRGRLTAVVDWSLGERPGPDGDRGFDLATLFFYTQAVVTTRDWLWTRLLQVSGRDAATLYLAHLCLRQVEWSARHRPGSAELARYLTDAAAVLDRLETETA